MPSAVYLTVVAELRHAVANAMSSAEGMGRARAGLSSMFPRVVLRAVGVGYHLDPGDLSDDSRRPRPQPNKPPWGRGDPASVAVRTVT